MIIGQTRKTRSGTVGRSSTRIHNPDTQKSLAQNIPVSSNIDSWFKFGEHGCEGGGETGKEHTRQCQEWGRRCFWGVWRLSLSRLLSFLERVACSKEGQSTILWMVAWIKHPTYAVLLVSLCFPAAQWLWSYMISSIYFHRHSSVYSAGHTVQGIDGRLCQQLGRVDKITK